MFRKVRPPGRKLKATRPNLFMYLKTLIELYILKASSDFLYPQIMMIHEQLFYTYDV